MSSFVKHQLALSLSQRLTHRLMKEAAEADIEQTMRDVFVSVHESVTLQPFDTEFSGTTATVALTLVRLSMHRSDCSI